MTWAESFRVGSGYLADHYLRSDPPALAELDRLRRHVQGVFEGLDVPRPRVAYAVGGSATSLRRLVGAVLDHESLDPRRSACSASARRPRSPSEFELHPERVRLLPAGMLLLDAVADLLGVPLRVAKGGLREGVLLDRARPGGGAELAMAKAADIPLHPRHALRRGGGADGSTCARRRCGSTRRTCST